MNNSTNFTGKWRTTHWYPTQDDSTEHSDSYDMTAYQKGHEIVFESSPRDDKSYMIIRLHIDGDLATGTWEETTAPGGKYDGIVYSGAGQLILDDGNKRMVGRWAGIGYNHSTKKREIYPGRWEFIKVED